MCKPETLHHNKHGYVAWCPCCCFMNIAFGTWMIALEPHQVESFISALSLDVGYYEGKINTTDKSFVYNTDSPQVKLVLNHTEASHLLDLLNNAWLVHQANELLNDL